MNKKFLLDSFGFGILLWFIGYVLGILLFVVVPPALLGWVIMPIGIVIALWVLIKKINSLKSEYYLSIAIVWTIIAVIFDYFFLVQVFKPQDGYYKLDVYLYYLFTFLLPLIVGYLKSNKITSKKN
jgi:hypothetical protein